jgi:hypothetical protein
MVKFKPKKEEMYGELSEIILTNFMDSLEATLDNSTAYHLFSPFNSKLSFVDYFQYEDCYFGKKTNKKKIEKNDYIILNKLFCEWKNKDKKAERKIFDNAYYFPQTFSSKDEEIRKLKEENKLLRQKLKDALLMNKEVNIHNLIDLVQQEMEEQKNIIEKKLDDSQKVYLENLLTTQRKITCLLAAENTDKKDIFQKEKRLCKGQQELLKNSLVGAEELGTLFFSQEELTKLSIELEKY